MRPMLGKRNIYLIGPMGTGKTAVGKSLGRITGVPFVDSDAEIERHAGVDIPYIFEQEGEEGFRRREREALAELCMREPLVLATVIRMRWPLLKIWLVQPTSKATLVILPGSRKTSLS